MLNQEHVQVAHEIVKNGSPALLNVAGRMLGLGQAEQTALSNGKLPFWFWAAVGVTGGFILGVFVRGKWPNKIPKAIGGE